MKRLLPLVFVVGCGGSAQTTLSIQHAGCASCADPVKKKLGATPGVESVQFSRPKAEFAVEYDPDQIDPPRLAALASEAVGLQVVVGAGRGSYSDGQTWPESADVQVISEDVPLEPVLGKVTVFDFFAEWCKPCREVDVALQKLSAKHPNLAIRRINIGDWGSALAEKHMKGIAELPYVRVYGPDGAVAGQIIGLDLAQMQATIEKAGK